MLAGATVGLFEALFLLSTTGAAEYGALFYAVVLYAVLGVGFGAGIGLGVVVLGLVFKKFPDSMAFTLPFVGVIAAMGAVITLYVVRKMVYLEQAVPMAAKLQVLGAFGALTLLGLWLGPIFLTRTPFKVLLRVRGAFTLYGGLALLSGIFAFAPGDVDPVGNMNPDTEQPASLAERPNVLLIMVDTLRWDYLGSYDSEKADLTPVMDALADDSVLFERFYTAASWTRASTASLFSSMPPSSHDTALKVAVLPDAVDTVAEVLQGQGYVTGALPNNINVTRSFNFQQGFDWFEYQAPDYLFGATESASQLSMYNVVRKVKEKLSGKTKVVTDFYQPADVVLGRAKDFVRSQQEKRWFLFAHLMEPHDPYFEQPYNGVGFARAETPNPDPEQVDYLKKVYAGEVQKLDEEIGVFIDWLKESGTYDDTVIVLTSDHGEEFFEHGGWWHGTTLYDEQIRVPLIVKLPNQEHAGARVPWQVRQLDVAPSLAVLAGASTPDQWQGSDLFDEAFVKGLEALAAPVVAQEGEALEEGAEPVPSIEGEPGVYPDLDRLVFAEENFEGNVLASIQTEGWKLITANEGNPRGLARRELYHVAVDPLEQNNLVGEPLGRQNDLEAMVVEQVRLATERGLSGTTAELDDVTLERMRALGYVE